MSAEQSKKLRPALSGASSDKKVQSKFDWDTVITKMENRGGYRLVIDEEAEKVYDKNGKEVPQYLKDEKGEYVKVPTGKKISPQSVKAELTQIRKILRGIYGEDGNPTLGDIKKSVPKMVEYIKGDNFKNNSQRKNAIVAMYHFYDALGIPYGISKEYFKEVADKALAERMGGLAGEIKEKFDKVDFDKIKEDAEKETNPTMRLMLKLYSGVIPIMRGQEWRGLKVIKTKKYVKSQLPPNYLLLHDKTLHITDAKSLGGEGAKLMALPDEILDEIKRYMETTGDDVLFDGMSASVMTKKFNKALGGYSIQSLRKRYISEQVKNGISPEEKVRLAKLMGHKLTTQMVDYTKEIS